MKKYFSIIVILFTIISFSTGCAANKETEPQINNISKATLMKITSTAFSDNGRVPEKYTCDGDNINPPVKFEEIPEGTKSLALLYEDPDAPMGTWIHWVVWNINPENPEILENSVPKDAELGKNDFGETSYGGPCPPSGTHRYVFKGYALDTMLQLPPGSLKKDLKAAIYGHVLAEAILTGNYSKK